jgi:hypothetical protein
MIVIARKWGLMCNQIFTMSHAIAAALECGTSVVNPAFKDYAAHFNCLKDDPLCRFPVRKPISVINTWAARLTRTPGAYLSDLIPRYHVSTRIARTIPIGWHEECRLDSELTRRYIQTTSLLFLEGWQFDKHAATIREFFAPRPELESRAVAAANKARDGCDVLVGVHIRHGDYKTHLNGKYFYETAEYARLMRDVASLFDGRAVGFLVSSNAKQDASAFQGLMWLPSDGHMVVDLYALSKCDYVIGPPSTYSQWASFYGQVPLCIVRDRSMKPALSDFVIFTTEMSQV